MQRIMAHAIIYQGRTYRMHVAELTDTGQLSLYPFDTEIHSTPFINGTITIDTIPDPHTGRPSLHILTPQKTHYTP